MPEEEIEPTQGGTPPDFEFRASASFAAPARQGGRKAAEPWASLAGRRRSGAARFQNLKFAVSTALTPGAGTARGSVLPG